MKLRKFTLWKKYEISQKCKTTINWSYTVQLPKISNEHHILTRWSNHHFITWEKAHHNSNSKLQQSHSLHLYILMTATPLSLFKLVSCRHFFLLHFQNEYIRCCPQETDSTQRIYLFLSVKGLKGSDHIYTTVIIYIQFIFGAAKNRFMLRRQQLTI